MSQQADISFTENYNALKSVADTLRNNSEQNIDTLVPLVDKATTAYKNCQARLKQVEVMLKERIGDNG